MNARNRPRQNTRVIILRHSERLDSALGNNQWPRQAFVNNVYHPYAQEMPTSLPTRSQPLDYALDTPLSREGQQHAHQMGEYFHSIGFIPDRVYVSPSFRCIQTADAVLEGLGLHGRKPLRIDLALHEPTKQKIPIKTPEYYHAANYFIDLEYKPVLSATHPELIVNESSEKFYQRMQNAMKQIVKQPATPRMILIVTHLPCVVPLSAMLNIERVPDRKAYLKKFYEQSRETVKFMSFSMAEYDVTTGIWNFHHTYPPGLNGRKKLN